MYLTVDMQNARQRLEQTDFRLQQQINTEADHMLQDKRDKKYQNIFRNEIGYKRIHTHSL